MEVGDEKGHFLGLQRWKGLLTGENGEIVKMRERQRFDLIPGKGVQANWVYFLSHLMMVPQSLSDSNGQ